ncbi:hypothetical protein MP228_001990 [Amoeboaphelidium protococcarum]|nr:hypothetical protein MP228_001990 [Amoeboaphelidium protococcarum]
MINRIDCAPTIFVNQVSFKISQDNSAILKLEPSLGVQLLQPRESQSSQVICAERWKSVTQFYSSPMRIVFYSESNETLRLTATKSRGGILNNEPSKSDTAILLAKQRLPTAQAAVNLSPMPAQVVTSNLHADSFHRRIVQGHYVNFNNPSESPSLMIANMHYIKCIVHCDWLVEQPVMLMMLPHYMFGVFASCKRYERLLSDPIHTDKLWVIPAPKYQCPGLNSYRVQIALVMHDASSVSWAWTNDIDQKSRHDEQFKNKKIKALLFPIKSYTFYIGIAAAAAVGAADFVGPAAAAVGVGTGTGTGSQRWLLNLSFSQVGGEN